MQKAGAEAGWPLGQSQAKGPANYPAFGGKDTPEFDVKDVLRSLKDFPEAFGPEVPVAPASGPLSGLKATAPAAVNPIGTTDMQDAGLQKWVNGGGTPEGYAAARGRLQPPQMRTGPEGFGPNTVGAAQRQPYLPSSVAENKGMSLEDQDAWAAAKAANPGTTDSQLDSWFTQNKLGGDPNQGKSTQEMMQQLLGLYTKKP